MKIYFKIILIISFLIPAYCFSYNYDLKESKVFPKDKPKLVKRKVKKMFKEAIEFIYSEEYDKALPLFKKLLKKDPNNYSFNFFAGVCYFNLKAPKSTILPYFEKASQQTVVDYNDNVSERRSPAFAIYYKAQLYMLDNKYEEAYNNLIKFKSLIPSVNTKLLKEVTRMIEVCGYAKVLTDNPLKNVVIESFPAMNSTFFDYGAQMSADGNMIFFSSKRKGNLGEPDKDGQYKSDIYYIKKESNKWSEAIPFKNANSEANDNFCSLSADGNVLFFSSDREGNQYDIYYCLKLVSNEWSTPRKLESTVNSKANETYAWLVQNWKTLYFVSDRKDGFGGRDIYISKKLDDGTWGEAINLGSTINTIYDEKSPFAPEDGKNFYFSSKGHKSMGGFDIFYSKNENGKWTDPVNLGCPVNTPYDDQYYNISNDGKTVLYSSAKKGLDGTTDVFLVKYFNIEDTKKIKELLDKTAFTDTVPSEKKLTASKDVIYTVQIGAGINLKISAFNVLYGVKECVSKDGLKRFIIGEFKTREEADALRQEIIKLGFSDAWIPTIDLDRVDCE
ncbi:MAG: hypothetical protein PHD97_05115 [Bacteroidales bacterium]|nr:hypothetical protein [Bacteroidales bacterium]